MKAEVLPGFEEDEAFIKIRVETSDEADILTKLYRNGVRVVSGSRWDIVIADPKLANLHALYLGDDDLKMVHDALAKYHIKDGKLSNLIIKTYPQ